MSGAPAVFSPNVMRAPDPATFAQLIDVQNENHNTVLEFDHFADHVSQIAKRLDDIKDITADWLSLIAPHAYSNDLRNDINEFACRLLIAMTRLEHLKDTIPPEKRFQCIEESAEFATACEIEWMNFKPLVTPFLPKPAEPDTDEEDLEHVEQSVHGDEDDAPLAGLLIPEPAALVPEPAALPDPEPKRRRRRNPTCITVADDADPTVHDW
jgi:hypothetical protein